MTPDRVMIVSAVEPFGAGLHRSLAAGLAEALQQRGHAVEQVLAPLSPADMVEPQCRLCQGMDLIDVCDHVVALRPPAHLVRHPRLSVWLSSHAGYAAEAGRDGAALASAHRVFATCVEAAARWAPLAGRDVPVLAPPWPVKPSGRNDPAAVGCPGPLAQGDRVDGLLAAMRLVRTPLRLHLGNTTDPLSHLRFRLQAARAPDRVSLEPAHPGLLVSLSADDDVALRVIDMAIARGVPVLVADDCAAARARAEAGAGVAVPPHDPALIAAALNALTLDAVARPVSTPITRPSWDHVLSALTGP